MSPATPGELLRAAGVPLKVRSAILGHASTSSLSVTEDRYTHLMPGDLDATMQALATYASLEKRHRKRHAGHLSGHPRRQISDGLGFAPP
jgi:hypothetical protein